MFSPTAKVLFSFFFCLSLYSQAKLMIHNSVDLTNKLNAVNGIDYTILTPQNKITYKKSFIGNLILADPEDGCKDLKSMDTTGSQGTYNPILIVTWGSCHYVQKVKNAEAAGAKMILLVLRHDLAENHPTVRQISLSTNIEVLAIAQSHGDRIVEFLKENNQKAPEEQQQVELTYTADIERHPHYNSQKTVSLSFWFSASDISKNSYSFLSDLRELLRGFAGHFTFEPHYVVWEAHEEWQNDFKGQHDRCLSGGRYCDPEHFIEGRLSGAEGVLEDVRQIALITTSSTLDNLDNDWWRYVKTFGDLCIDKPLSQMKECRDNVYKTAEISHATVNAVESAVKKSFDPSVETIEECKNTKSDNTYLKKEIIEKNRQDVDHYPSFYVNRERYTASFRNMNAVKQFICSHFVQDVIPEACKPAGQIVNSHHEISPYLIIIIVSIFVMIITLYCVRRSVKRQVMGRMNDEISHIVTQYKQFKDKSNTSAADDDI